MVLYHNVSKYFNYLRITFSLAIKKFKESCSWIGLTPSLHTGVSSCGWELRDWSRPLLASAEPLTPCSTKMHIFHNDKTKCKILKIICGWKCTLIMLLQKIWVSSMEDLIILTNNNSKCITILWITETREQTLKVLFLCYSWNLMLFFKYYACRESIENQRLTYKFYTHLRNRLESVWRQYISNSALQLRTRLCSDRF